MSPTEEPSKVVALLGRLEQVLGERGALIERLEGLDAGVGLQEAPEVAALRARLAHLTREQTRLVGALAARVPPDEPPIAPSVGVLSGGRRGAPTA